MISVNRTRPETVEEAVDLLIKYKEKEGKNPTVVGLELSGDPRKGQFSDFVQQFKRAQNEGFKVSLHCGET